MISNNTQILDDIKNSIYHAGEQLEADNRLTWTEIGSFVNKMIIDVEKRLEVGAIRYGIQVPIFKSEDNTRDNLAEAIEEIQDSLVYCTALKIQIAELRHYQIVNSNNIRKSIENDTVKHHGISLEREKKELIFKANLEEKQQKNYVNEYSLNIASAISYLQYSYFLLKKAETIKDNININNITSEEETT